MILTGVLMLGLVGCADSHGEDTISHEYPHAWINYQTNEPAIIALSIEEDGDVSRSIQTRPATSSSMVPVTRDTFTLSADELYTLQQLTIPEKIELYRLDQGAGQKIRIYIEDAQSSGSIRLEAREANSEATGALPSFFNALAQRDTQVP